MIVETERLILDELSLNDAEFIFELMNSPGWLEHIGDRGIKTLEDARTYLTSRLISSYRINGFGLYRVLEKEKKLPVGLCGLVNRASLPYPDIGFAFLPSSIGKGYGLESAKAVLRFSKETLGLEKVVAITSPNNKRSQKLLEKIGLKLERIIKIPDYE